MLSHVIQGCPLCSRTRVQSSPGALLPKVVICQIQPSPRLGHLDPLSSYLSCCSFISTTRTINNIKGKGWSLTKRLRLKGDPLQGPTVAHGQRLNAQLCSELKQGSLCSVGVRCSLLPKPSQEAAAAARGQEGTPPSEEGRPLPFLPCGGGWAGREAELVRQDGALARGPLDQTAGLTLSSATS